MSYQKATVVGNIGKDAEVRTTQSGAKAIGFSLAVNRTWVDDDGVEHKQSTWFNCTKWIYNGGSIKVASYLKKGTLVALDGEVSASAYKNDKGEAIGSLELKVGDLRLLSSAKKEEGSQS